MNYRVVAHLISIITLTVSVALSVSFCVGLFYMRDSVADSEALSGFGYSVAVSWFITLFLYSLGQRDFERVFRKEGLCVIGLGWLLSSFLASLPFYFVLKGYSFCDAFFEASSGITTTGATVLSDLESLPHSILFWRSLTQWIGGLGVVVLFVALLSSLGAEAKILFSHESSGKSTDVDYGHIRKAARSIMFLYLGLSMMLVLILRMVGMNWFDAICHMFTTISTGGFSTRTASIAAYANPLLEWILIVFMAIGGTSFILMLRFFNGHSKDVWKNTEFKMYYGILFIVGLIVCFDLMFYAGYSSFENAFRTSLFQVVSVMTTTGFCTADFDQWNLAPKFMMLCIMFVGGMSGSTSGGTKVIRTVITFKILRKNVESIYRPQAVRPIFINNRMISSEIQSQVLGLLTLGVAVLVVSILLLSFVERDLDLLSLCSGVFTCVFNVGPGLNELGPTKEFSGLTEFSKAWLGLLMVMGRLEFYAILVLFCPSLWKRYR